MTAHHRQDSDAGSANTIFYNPALFDSNGSPKWARVLDPGYSCLSRSTIFLNPALLDGTLSPSTDYRTSVPDTSPFASLFTYLKQCLLSTDAANTAYIASLFPVFSRGKICSVESAEAFLLSDIAPPRWTKTRTAGPSRKLDKWRKGLGEYLDGVKLVYCPSVSSPKGQEEGIRRGEEGEAAYVPMSVDLGEGERCARIAVVGEYETLFSEETEQSATEKGKEKEPTGVRDPLEPVKLFLFVNLLRAVGEGYARWSGFTPRASLLDHIPAMLAGCKPQLVRIDDQYHLIAPPSTSSPSSSATTVFTALRTSHISKLLRQIQTGRAPPAPWFSGEKAAFRVIVKQAQSGTEPDEERESYREPPSRASDASDESFLTSSSSDPSLSEGDTLSPSTSTLSLVNEEPEPTPTPFSSSPPHFPHPLQWGEGSILTFHAPSPFLSPPTSSPSRHVSPPSPFSPRTPKHTSTATPSSLLLSCNPPHLRSLALSALASISSLDMSHSDPDSCSDHAVGTEPGRKGFSPLVQDQVVFVDADGDEAISPKGGECGEQRERHGMLVDVWTNGRWVVGVGRFWDGEAVGDGYRDVDC